MFTKRWKIWLISVRFLAALFLLVGPIGNGFAQQKQLVKIVTVTPGVPWHTLGARVAAELNKRLPNISAAGATGPGGGNVVLVSKGDAQIAWMVNLALRDAWNGEVAFKGKPIRNFTLISPFAVTPWQVIVRKDSKIQSIQDLVKHRVAIGAPAGGTTALSLKVLKRLGITPEDFKKNGGLLVYTAYDAWPVQMQDKTVDAVLYWGGLPSGMTVTMINEPGVRFVSLTDQEYKNVLGDPELSTLLIPMTIPKGFYQPITKDINSFAFTSLAISMPNLDEKVTYETAKLLNEGPPEVKEIYKDGLSLTLELAKIWFEKAQEFPLHPGAAQYFREKKIIK